MVRSKFVLYGVFQDCYVIGSSTFLPIHFDDQHSTLLTGLPVSKNPHIILTSLYKRIIKVLALMPEESSYRRHTNEIVQSRLNAVQKISDIPTLESTIDCGQIEEVIVQAQREYDLARNMLKWKPWEPLIEEAPRDQWKWPL
uniref:NADH dehydrogenase [ubiquinone] 1 alpha subcomplex subunit 5 n=1 Tax=Schistosoma haematobium TaxID=6185 RepID=A0A094ZK60_SCHHA